MSIIDEITKLGIAPKLKTGSEYSSPCPKCGGEDRFIIWTDSQRYWCRQCSAKGDLIQFFRDFQGLSFSDAKRRAGGNIFTDNKPNGQARPTKNNSRPNPPTNKKKISNPDLWRSKAKAFVDWACGQLLNNRENILERLKAARGIKPETAEKYRLGYCRKDFYIDRASWGLEKEVKENGQLKKLWLPQGLVIPKFSDNGEITRIRVRRLGEDKPKYCLLSGSEVSPMVLGAPKAEYAVLIESELDAFLLEQEIKEEVFIIATGSVTANLDDELIEALFNKKVFVSYDNDQAGIKAVKSDIEILNACYLPPIEGKDITESFMEGGVNLWKWFKAGKELYRRKLSGIIKF